MLAVFSGHNEGCNKRKGNICLFVMAQDTGPYLKSFMLMYNENSPEIQSSLDEFFPRLALLFAAPGSL